MPVDVIARMLIVPAVPAWLEVVSAMVGSPVAAMFVAVGQKRPTPVARYGEPPPLWVYATLTT